MQRLDPATIGGGFVTTGDACLDVMFGGGFILGGITELVGESGSGKTQLALQACLTVQLPHSKGGLSGSACFLTTFGGLPTPRLMQLVEDNPVLKSEACSLTNIHTRTVSSPAELLHTLRQGTADLIQHIAETSSSLPLKMLIIDSMAALFRSDVKTTSETLIDRSRQLIDIAAILHHLASTHEIGIIIINEVTSFIDRRAQPSEPNYENDLKRNIYYSEQSRWFSRGSSLPSEGYSEACLGLVWANQVGLRVMMSRTGRRRFLSDFRRTVGGTEPEENETIVIRRLSIIFSCHSPLSSIDFIISRTGLSTLGKILPVAAPDSAALAAVTKGFMNNIVEV